MTDLDATLTASEDQDEGVGGSETGPPPLLGRYIKLSVLGRGSMGTVLLAYDTRLDRKVALKLLHQRITTEAMLDEARALARVSHRNVVTVYDADDYADQGFIAMEFVQGQTLRAWQRSEARAVIEVVSQYAQVARGLAAVHAAGLVHRDIKPENVMVSDDDRVLVMDFGVAGKSQRTVVAEGAMAEETTGEAVESQPLVGTPAYMAPEEFEGDGSTPKSDQFSFCVALYEALTQTRPFEGESVWELSLSVSQGRRTSRPANSVVPRALAAVLDRGLSTEPDDRFVSMDALLAALDRAMRRWPLRLGIASAALTAVAAAAVLARPPSPCEVEQAKFEASWSSQLRTSLRNGFIASDHPDATGIATAFDERIDDFASAWQVETASLCQGGRPPAVVMPQRACLGLQRTQLETLTESLEAPDRPLAALALEAASSLPKPTWCTGARPEIDIAATYAEALIPVERELAAAQAMFSLGKLKDAKSHAEAALQLSEASGLVRGRARTKARLFRISQSEGEFSAAERWLADALRDAASAADDELLAGLWTSRTRQALESKRDKDSAAMWLEIAEVAVARIGAPPIHQAALHNARGQFLDAHDHIDDALVQFEKAVALGREHALESGRVASFLNNQATMLAKAGKAAESRVLFVEAASVATEALGAGNRALVTYRNNAANACMQLRDWECALVEFAEIERVLDGLGDESSPARARMHGGYSQAAYFVDDYALARQHARAALSLFEELGLHHHRRAAAPLATLTRIGLKLKEFEDALPAAERLVALDAKLRPSDGPAGVVAIVLRARVLIGLGRGADALSGIQTLRQALEASGLDPEVGEVLVVESEALDALGRRDEAVATVERAIKLLPSAERPAAEAWLAQLQGRP